MAANSNSGLVESHRWETTTGLDKIQTKDVDIAANCTSTTDSDNASGGLFERISSKTLQTRRLPAWMSCEDDPKKKSKTYDSSHCGGGSVCPVCTSQSRPPLTFNGAIEYIHNAAEADFVCETILGRQPAQLGFDIEWKVTFTRGQAPLQCPTALVQLCLSSTRCYLFQVRRMKAFPYKLKEILESPDILKLGVGIRGDSFKLHRDYDIHCQGVIDLSCVANKILRSFETWSLKDLVLHLFHLELSKENRVRLSNWEVALCPDQQVYAATDAYAGLLIYQKLQSIRTEREIHSN